MKSVVIEVVGLPKPQGSMSAVGRGRVVHPKGVLAWRKIVATYARQVFHGELWDEAVHMDVTFYLPRPKSHKKPAVRAGDPYPSRRPDLDKLVRAIGDSLEKVVYAQDSRIVETLSRKRWTRWPDGKPGARIELKWALETSGPVDRQIAADRVRSPIDVNIHPVLRQAERKSKKDDRRFQSFNLVQIHHAHDRLVNVPRRLAVIRFGAVDDFGKVIHDLRRRPCAGLSAAQDFDCDLLSN